MGLSRRGATVAEIPWGCRFDAYVLDAQRGVVYTGRSTHLNQKGGGMPNLAQSFVHLGLGATAVEMPPYDGMDWYAEYGARTAGDGAEGRLVSYYTFTESWDSWEAHPAGDELVVCTAGRMTIIQELPDGSERSVTLGPGDYTINPPGVWHTADIAAEDGPATALFITPGTGTEHRQR